MQAAGDSKRTDSPVEHPALSEIVSLVGIGGFLATCYKSNLISHCRVIPELKRVLSFEIDCRKTGVERALFGNFFS